jgi:glyoxylase-like metal-dependent hydrolase (beta-lactamase superfamily II)
MVSFTSDSLICERYILGPLEVNTYLIYEKNASDAILIDPAENSDTLVRRLNELNFSQLTIFLTHGHADHICGVDFFKKKFPGSKVAISVADAPMLPDPGLNLSLYIGDAITVSEPDQTLNDGDLLSTGGISGVVRAIPGHTPGGMVLIFENMVFSGDTLFAGSVGRSDFPGGNGKDLIEGIKNSIFSLSDRPVFPGHGPETTIATEKKSNPFFGTFFNV